jgi:hypothetical protein
VLRCFCAALKAPGHREGARSAALSAAPKIFHSELGARKPNADDDRYEEKIVNVHFTSFAVRDPEQRNNLRNITLRPISGPAPVDKVRIPDSFLMKC